MKTLFLYCFILVFIIKINAQVNLVPNPSFETYSTCPDNFSQINYATGWYSASAGTPDYFNACQTISFGFGVPSNGAGFQVAQQGNAYAGVYVFGATPAPQREYIQTQLLDTMKAGKPYCISFYVNRSNYLNIAITQIGAFISTTAVSSGTELPLPYTPQIISPVGYYLNDTLPWIKISGTYIAIGGEKFITIGNYKDEVSTDTIQTGSNLAGYYYIDNVSVIECEELIIPNIFTSNNDGVNDFFEIKNLPPNTSTQIFNRWGTKVFETNKSDVFWDGRTTGGIECVDGTYYYIITTEEEVYKGFLQLIH